MDKGRTDRGFKVIEFEDTYGQKCKLQESSSVEPRIWLGIGKPDVIFLDKAEGWVDYPLPPEVRIMSIMHLSPEQVKELLPYLERFAKKGQL